MEPILAVPSGAQATRDAHGGPCTHGLWARTALTDPSQAPALFLPIGPFSGFHHLSYQHYLAAERDRNMPEHCGPMPPLDAFALICE